MGEKKCNEIVYPRERYGAFKGHRCGRPAKFACIIGENMETGNAIQGMRCGIHAKRYEERKPLKGNYTFNSTR